MATARAPFLLRLLPSLADFAFLAPVVFLFGRLDGMKVLLSDCDTGLHIRTGQWILANYAVPSRDFFSFSKAGEPWIAWEWLAAVIFAGLNALGGLNAVALFSTILLALTSGLLYRLVRRRANVILAFLITVWAVIAGSIHWLARPHLFTLFLVVLFCMALESMREGRTHFAKIPFTVLLPASMVLWTNLHGGFFVGIVLVAAYGAGELLPGLLLSSRGDCSAAWRRAKPYFIATAGCLAATLVNPYGWHLYVQMVKFLRDPFMTSRIADFLPLEFSHPMAKLFEAMLLLAVVAVGWSISRGRFTEAVVMLGCGHAALLASRNIPIFMITAAPLVAACVQEWLDRIPSSQAATWLRNAASSLNDAAARMAATEAVGRFRLTSIAGIVLVAALIWAPNAPGRFRAEFDPSRHPAAALAKLRDLPGARIFTYDQWGDYLIWSLYPSHRVFVDGRIDFYGAEFDRQYIDVLSVRNDWDQVLDRYRVDTVLMPPGTALTGALKESSRWRLVYDDGIALVFRSATRPGDLSVSAVDVDGGKGRDREVTRTQSGDRAITVHNPRT